MVSPEELECISILLCDDIYRDELTKKLVIVGTFNQINVLATPAVHPQLCVLFSLTNGNGEYELSLSIEHEASGQEIVQLAGPAEVNDPLAITDVDVRLRGVEFPEEGKYWVVLRSGERILQQRPFAVRRQESGHEIQKRSDE